MATRKARRILSRIASNCPKARDSEMEGTRLIVMEAVKMVAKFTKGTAMPVK